MQGQGARKDDVYGKGLLHGAAHVCLWRMEKGEPQVLVQKRAATKRTWPNRFDISAAGHIDLGEDPFGCALRETQEEIGLAINEADLRLINVRRAYMEVGDGSTENEFQWLYLFKLPDNTEFSMQTEEVSSVEWKALETYQHETQTDNNRYVPHGTPYFATVIAAIETELAKR